MKNKETYYEPTYELWQHIITVEVNVANVYLLLCYWIKNMTRFQIGHSDTSRCVQ